MAQVSETNLRLEEVVVTARRREETAQSIPVSVSAFGAQMLEDLSVRTVGDVADFTPNVARTAGPTGGNDGFFFIRGIGQVDSNPAADPGVGVYIDGVYLGRVQGSSFESLDIARVEVMRGPQGTFFGRNTIGGAINIVTADPGDELALKGRITVGERDRIDGAFSLNVPVSDSFGVILSGMSRNQDGWSRNIHTGETFGDTETLSGRVKAVWDATEDLRISVTADGLRARGGSQDQLLVGFNPAAGNIPGTSPLGVPYPADFTAELATDPFVSSSDMDPRQETDNYGLSGMIDWQGDAVNVKAIVAYREVEQFANNDFDGTSYSFYNNFFDTKAEQMSAELQFSGSSFNDRLDWLVGFYYFDEDISHNNGICMGTNIGIPGVAVRGDGRCLRNNQQFELDVESWAAFTHLGYKLTDTLTATVGLRYTYEKKNQTFDFFLDNTAGVFSFFGIPTGIIPTLSPDNPNLNIPTEYKDSWKEFTPKFGLDYQATDDMLLYASYARGFKSGGFNGRPNPNATGGFNEILPYDPETVDTFELGVKSDWFDNRLRLNMSAFYSIYKGIQLMTLDFESGFFQVSNAGKNKIKGFEIEMMARPVAELDLFAGVGYLDDKYSEIDPRAVGFTLDDRLPVTPHWTLNLGAQYTIGLGNLGSLALRGDWNYRSSIYYGATNNPLEYQKGYGIANVRATFAPPGERVRLAIYGLNVFDKTYYSNAQDVRDALGVAFVSVGAPSEWGAELSFSF